MKRIALIGAQNAGKSTLFNVLTDVHVSTANYAGATVSFQSAHAKSSLLKDCEIIDTPGLVNLSGNTPEQEACVNTLFSAEFNAELFVVVIDATQLRRQLYLVRQFKKTRLPILVVLSMIDLAEADGIEIDITTLSKELELPCLAINNHDNKSIFPLVEKIEKTFVAQDKSANESKIEKKFSCCKVEDFKASHDEVEAEYQAIDELVAKVAKENNSYSMGADRYLLHPFWGTILFLLIMTGLFTSVYALAGYPMEWIENGFAWLKECLETQMSDSTFKDVFINGIVEGIFSVVVFLPQIIILFFLIAFLEATGYLARAAMLIDKPLSKLGLNGRSFVPMLSGFACAIPAMMAARTIRSKPERLLTIFLIPLMSCSARLPVYIILISFITDNALIGGFIMAGLYFFSILIASIVALIASRFGAFKSNGQSHFQLEIPSLKMPFLRNVLKSTYERSLNYLKKAGVPILLIGISLWFFTHYPKQNDEYSAVANSYAAKVGKVLEPALKPMGLDWRGGVALTASFAAREVFVESMVLVYRADDEVLANAEGLDEDETTKQKLIQRMRNVSFEGTDEKIFTISTIMGLIFFFTMALQCFPTVAVAKHEMASTKLAMIQLFSYTGIAYIGAIIIVQVLRLCGFA